jgi:hypothetical protein
MGLPPFPAGDANHAGTDPAAEAGITAVAPAAFRPMPAPPAGPAHAGFPEKGRRGGGALMFGIIVPAVALVVALAALAWSLFRDPMGPGLRGYDLSTPKGTLRAELEMALNMDVRAAIELEYRRNAARSKEKLKTLEVRKQADWKGTTILFVTYLRKGLRQHEVVGYEKNAEAGIWAPKFVSSYDVRSDNRELAEAMDLWVCKGEIK